MNQAHTIAFGMFILSACAGGPAPPVAAPRSEPALPTSETEVQRAVIPAGPSIAISDELVRLCRPSIVG